MNPCELTVAITAAANTIACTLTDKEIAILCAILSQLNSTLGTIITQREICDKGEIPFIEELV